MIVIGVTGSLATGKTTVSRIFKDLGAEVVDADRIARRVLRSARIKKKVVSSFGPKVLNNSGFIDRAKLARIVFDNKGELDKLCRIVHPTVIEEIRRRINRGPAKKGRTIVIDAPLLIEAGVYDLADAVVVVKANQKDQLQRAVKHLRMDESEALRRIKFQMPLKEKVRLADYVIDNSGTLAETRKQVKGVWKELVKE